MVVIMLPFSVSERRNEDQLTRTRVTTSVLEAAPSRTVRPPPVVNVRARADDGMGEAVDGDVQPDTLNQAYMYCSHQLTAPHALLKSGKSLHAFCTLLGSHSVAPQPVVQADMVRLTPSCPQS